MRAAKHGNGLVREEARRLLDNLLKSGCVTVREARGALSSVSLRSRDTAGKVDDDMMGDIVEGACLREEVREAGRVAEREKEEARREAQNVAKEAQVIKQRAKEVGERIEREMR